MAMQYAQHAAANALIAGTKNVDMCAAYILLSLYPTPVKRWAQQRSWLYLGLAIRYVHFSYYAAVLITYHCCVLILGLPPT